MTLSKRNIILYVVCILAGFAVIFSAVRAWTDPTQTPPGGSPGPIQPVGAVIAFGGSTAPTGWLLCNGQAVSRTTYANLFAAIGTTYGAGDGSTTFNLPNTKGKALVGYDSGQTEFNGLGNSGGTKTHTLTTAEMPSHTHTQNAHTHAITDPGHTHYIKQLSGTSGSTRVHDAGPDDDNPIYSGSATTGISIQNTTATNNLSGGGGAHNNLQPYIVLNYIIKY